MKRMADVSDIRAISSELAPTPEEVGELEEASSLLRREIPAGVEAFQISGPFFFGVAHRLKDALERVASPPRVFILRLRRVPVIDATGLHALEEFHERCRRRGTVLVLSGVQPEPLRVFRRIGFDAKCGRENIVENIDRALERAREILGAAQPTATPNPPVAATH
jgi:SulP family sulfate permease